LIIGAACILASVSCGSPPAVFPALTSRTTKSADRLPIMVTGPTIRYYSAVDQRLRVPYYLAFSRTGVPWFTPSTDHLGLMTSPGKFEARGLPIKRNGELPEEPAQIAIGPDGHLWFTDGYGDTVGTVNSNGKPLQYKTYADGYTAGLVSGPRNHLWVSISGTYGTDLAEFDTTPRLIKLWKLKGYSCYQETIARGPHDLLWVGSSGNCQKITLFTPDGHVTDYYVQAYLGVWGIAEGRDGNMWFGGAGGQNGPWYISKITSSGTITKYLTSGMVGYVAAGPDGNMWFTEPWTGIIGNVTMQGVVTEYPPNDIKPVPSDARPKGSIYYRVADIVRGPDGNMWFASPQANGLGEVVLTPNHR
jgi:virginiamycin B lyase